MINREDAPEGYYAEEQNSLTLSCVSCSFVVPPEGCSRGPIPVKGPSCYSGLRKDKTNVIFIKKSELTKED